MNQENQNSKAVDCLNSLLRGELSAMETYDIALRRVDDNHATAAEELRAISADHIEHARILQGAVRSLGGVPSNDSGAWGTYAKTVEGSAALFGDTAAIKALKEGEERGLKEYSAAVEKMDLDESTRGVITRQLLPNQQRHINTLDALLAQDL